MKKVFDDIFSGNGPKIATIESGKFDIKRSKNYKQNLFQIIQHIDPESLKDFRF